MQNCKMKLNKSSAENLDLTNDNTLLMNKNRKVPEYFTSFSNLFFYIFNTLFPFLNNGLIETNLIIQQHYFLSAGVCLKQLIVKEGLTKSHIDTRIKPCVCEDAQTIYRH